MTRFYAGLALAGFCASGGAVTPFPWTDLLIIAGLIVLNGIFAMSELAIVSARASRLSLQSWTRWAWRSRRA